MLKYLELLVNQVSSFQSVFYDSPSINFSISKNYSPVGKSPLFFSRSTPRDREDGTGDEDAEQDRINPGEDI